MINKKLFWLIPLALLAACSRQQMSTFHDKKSQFQVNYPTNLKPIKTTALTGLVNSWTITSDTPYSKQRRQLLALQIFNKTIKTKDLGVQAINVFWRATISSNKAEIKNCYKPKNATYISDKIIHGHMYRLYNFSEGGMMHVHKAQILRYHNDNYCYNVEADFIYPNAMTKSLSYLIEQAHNRADAISRTVRIG